MIFKNDRNQTITVATATELANGSYELKATVLLPTGQENFFGVRAAREREVEYILMIDSTGAPSGKQLPKTSFLNRQLDDTPFSRELSSIGRDLYNRLDEIFDHFNIKPNFQQTTPNYVIYGAVSNDTNHYIDRIEDRDENGYILTGRLSDNNPFNIHFDVMKNIISYEGIQSDSLLAKRILTQKNQIFNHILPIPMAPKVVNAECFIQDITLTEASSPKEPKIKLFNLASLSCKPIYHKPPYEDDKDDYDKNNKSNRNSEDYGNTPIKKFKI